MSAKAKSASGKSTPVGETQVVVTPKFEGVHPSTLPFPEWSDSELNAEKWELPKSKEKAKPVKKGELPPPPPPPAYFEDPKAVHLPPSLSKDVVEWKRPFEIFPNNPFVVYKESTNYTELKNGSKHILDSEFIRSFISSINTLEYLGSVHPTPIEFVTTVYTPNTQGEPWRPWHHIYSSCKAGKGQKHKPVVNQLGKYALRLFWLGAWRKILVDDRLPINGNNEILLPSYEIVKVQQSAPSTPTSKKSGKSEKSGKSVKSVAANAIALWPFLLAKGLMKIASMSYGSADDLYDFDISCCLTGWFCQKIDVSRMGLLDKWGICLKYADNYKWPEDNKAQSRGGSAKSNKSDKSSKSSKKGKVVNVNEKLITYTIVASCSEIPFREDNPVNLSPCLPHHFLIDQVRNIPLNKPPEQPPLPLWKTYRWLEWAIGKGIWIVHDYSNLRSAKIISNFKNYPEMERSETKHSFVSEPTSLKSDKGSKKGTKLLIPDPSNWEDFNTIAEYITDIYIFFKRSLFQSNIVITDVAKKADKGAKPTGNEPIFIPWTKDIQESRNDGVYIFMESVKEVTMMINLSQVGDINAFTYDPPPLEEEVNLTEEECTIDYSKSENTVVNVENMVVEEEFDYNNFDVRLFKKPFAHLVMENYDWQERQIGDVLTTLTTDGFKCIHLFLPPGRYVFRLWIKSDFSFVINISVSCAVTAGNFEQILPCLTKESEGMLKMSDRIGGAISELITSFGNPTYRDSLKKFYSSYLPNTTLTKIQSSKLHFTFFDEILSLIRRNSNNNDVKQNLSFIRILFHQPINSGLIRSTLCEDDQRSFCICESFHETENPEAEQAAYKIQAFFKRIYVKKLFSYHNKSHKRFKQIADVLKKINTLLFDPNKRILTVPYIMRKILENQHLIDIQDKYEDLRGFRNVVDLQQYKGSILSSQSCWLPLCRQTFTTTGDKIKICFFSDLSKFIVRVFNNDNLEEMQRFTNHTLVSEYEKNETGYTVLCYGWSLIPKSVSWKLSIITLKNNNPTVKLTPQAYLNNHILVNHYIPNAYNLICKCLISINEEVATSIRLSVDYPQVKLKLRCLNDRGDVLAELSGTHSIILPMVDLSVSKEPSISLSSRSSRSVRSARRTQSDAVIIRRSTGKESVKSRTSIQRKFSSNESNLVKGPTIFYIEGEVLEDSWPLRKEEWDVVEDLKSRALYRPSQFRSSITSSIKSDISQRRSSRRRISYTLDNILPPSWNLQTVSNKNNSVFAIIDHRREDEILLLKKSWYDPDPRRLQESMLLRETYLLNLHAKWENFLNSFTSLSSEYADIIQNELTESTEDERQSSIETNELKVLSILKATSVSKASAGTSIQENSEEKDSILTISRTLIRPVSKSKILPPFDLHDWPWKELLPGEERILKTAEYNEMIKSMNEQREEEFKQEQIMFETNLGSYMLDRQSRNKVLVHFFDECRKESAQMMKEAYDLREMMKKNQRALKK